MAERSTDGPKSGWSCVFWIGCSGHPTTTARYSVVLCSVLVVAVIVVAVVDVV